MQKGQNLRSNLTNQFFKDDGVDLIDYCPSRRTRLLVNVYKKCNVVVYEPTSFEKQIKVRNDKM